MKLKISLLNHSFETTSFVVRELRSWRDRWKRFFMDYPPANGNTIQYRATTTIIITTTQYKRNQRNVSAPARSLTNNRKRNSTKVPTKFPNLYTSMLFANSFCTKDKPKQPRKGEKPTISRIHLLPVDHHVTTKTTSPGGPLTTTDCPQTVRTKYNLNKTMSTTSART
jgi:hypothetical protein